MLRSHIRTSSSYFLDYSTKVTTTVMMLFPWCGLALLALLVVASSGYSYDAFSSSVPPGDVGTLYDAYFTNIQTMIPCTLTGRVTAEPASGKIVTDPVGCLPFRSGNFFSRVYPLTSHAALELNSICQSGLSAAANQTLEAVWGNFHSGEDPAVGIFLVLSDTDSNATTDATYNLSCIVSCAELWNGMVADGTALNHIAGFVSSDQSTSIFGGQIHSYAQLAASSLLWASHPSISLVFLRTTLSSAATLEFQSIVRAAYYNAQTQEAVLPSPAAMQYIGPMFSSASENASSCLADSTCMPIGGLNIIGTSASSAWSSVDNTTFVKTTPPGSVAIVVSATSVGLFHDAIPAADTSASGIVAALLALDAVLQVMGNAMLVNQSAPQLFGMFFVGEEYNRSGSSRFVDEASHFVCNRFPSDASAASFDCAFPIYRSLNFTTVDISNIQHFIQVEQVGYSETGSTLYYHVDGNLNSTASQGEANHALFYGAGLTPSSSTALGENSPLQSFLARNGGQSSYSLVSRYDSVFENPYVFTPSDLPTRLSLDAVKEAAEKLSTAIVALLGESGVVPPQINTTLADELWYCFTENFACASLGQSATTNVVVPPNYYTSVFQFDLVVQEYQQLIQQQLSQSPPGGTPLRVFRSHAFSPAATYEDTAVVSFGYEPKNGSVWVESNWGAVGCRIVALSSFASNGFGLLTVGVLVNVGVAVAMRFLYCS